MSYAQVAQEEKSMTNGKSKLLEAARRVRDEIYRSVQAELLDDTRTYQQIADANCISVATVQRIAGSLGIQRQVGPRPKSSTLEVSDGDN
jgi:hypothetical protein